MTSTACTSCIRAYQLASACARFGSILLTQPVICSSHSSAVAQEAHSAEAYAFGDRSTDSVEDYERTHGERDTNLHACLRFRTARRARWAGSARSFLHLPACMVLLPQSSRPVTTAKKTSRAGCSCCITALSSSGTSFCSSRTKG
jgi:hypothetical protein